MNCSPFFSQLNTEKIPSRVVKLFDSGATLSRAKVDRYVTASEEWRHTYKAKPKKTTELSSNEKLPTSLTFSRDGNFFVISTIDPNYQGVLSSLKISAELIQEAFTTSWSKTRLNSSYSPVSNRVHRVISIEEGGLYPAVYSMNQLLEANRERTQQNLFPGGQRPNLRSSVKNYISISQSHSFSKYLPLSAGSLPPIEIGSPKLLIRVSRFEEGKVEIDRPSRLFSDVRNGVHSAKILFELGLTFTRKGIIVEFNEGYLGENFSGSGWTVRQLLDHYGFSMNLNMMLQESNYPSPERFYVETEIAKFQEP